MKKFIITAFIATLFISANGIINAENYLSEIHNLTISEQHDHQIDSDINGEKIKITRWVDCPSCGGKGYKIIRKKCTCLNRGCEKCNYTGTIETRYECSRCGGKGRIQEEI